MNKKDIIALCGARGLSPSKKLGQNFLVSGNEAKRIMEALSLAKSDRVLEVGPGLGAITGEIVAVAGHCTAVEIDAGLARYLGERFAGEPNFTLVHGDFLKERLPDEFTVIVSNLPYYCSSEILFRFAADFSAPRVYVMLQRELGERILSKPGSKAYGALTVNLGFHFLPAALFSVPGSAFYPVPEVRSSFMLLRRRNAPLLEGAALQGLFHRIVRAAFWGRRKTLA
ncbi:MAG: ribosomal RNA small subunit methyltransferase A, partial [Spirochaetes bacterium]|nr:ribosomal RNA small subunit methyltransferase A [Spirochaetota bacterium]